MSGDPMHAGALGPIRRVLRREGVWGALASGCNLSREIVPCIEGGGFRFDQVRSACLPRTPRFAGNNIWDVA